MENLNKYFLESTLLAGVILAITFLVTYFLIRKRNSGRSKIDYVYSSFVGLLVYGILNFSIFGSTELSKAIYEFDRGIPDDADEDFSNLWDLTCPWGIIDKKQLGDGKIRRGCKYHIGQTFEKSSGNLNGILPDEYKPFPVPK